MADKKRVAITLQEKTLIFQHREEHGNNNEVRSGTVSKNQ